MPVFAGLAFAALPFTSQNRNQDGARLLAVTRLRCYRNTSSHLGIGKLSSGLTVRPCENPYRTDCLMAFPTTS
jgi:hypothetical protein